MYEEVEEEDKEMEKKKKVLSFWSLAISSGIDHLSN
jgi:hypothetical protein